MSVENGGAVARAAQALIGARFRLHGRDPATGLDCVGVAALALKDAGHEAAPPQGYALRGGDAAGWSRALDAAGLRRAGSARAGDLMLLSTGPGQAHLAVWTGRGFVHADAGLRRVVETPGWPRWSLIGLWRAGED